MSRFLYDRYRSFQRLSVPVPDGVARTLYNERRLRKSALQWVGNKLYYEPMLRNRCDVVGENLRTDGDIPLIYGTGRIVIGSHVRIGNRCAWILSPNLYETPELIIGDNTSINYLTGISVECRVEIGSHCVIAGETMIFDNNSHSIYYTNQRKMAEEDIAPIRIEDHVWIGMRSIILKGVTIGRGSVVAAGSVVTVSVPPMTLVGGNPARTLKCIELPETAGWHGGSGRERG